MGQFFELIHPVGNTLGGRFWLVARPAEPFHIDKTSNARRAHAGVMHHHIAPEAMADQIDRAVTRVMIEQEIEISQIVGKPVVVGRVARGQTITPPIGGDDLASLHERI